MPLRPPGITPRHPLTLASGFTPRDLAALRPVPPPSQHAAQRRRRVVAHGLDQFVDQGARLRWARGWGDVLWICRDVGGAAGVHRWTPSGRGGYCDLKIAQVCWGV